MKIPIIWLKDYVSTDKTPKELAASFTQLGLMLDKPLGDGSVLDLEHRMDRSDWLSIIGCARDLAAFENTPLLLPKVSLKAGKSPDPKSKIEINIQTPVVRRFQTRLIKGIKVRKSPEWLVERLRAYGMDSINNIVDITNFVMVEYGQPMHAQDIAKLPGSDITIRKAKAGEKLVTLLGTEVKLTPSTHVLTSGDVPIVILGVVGGKATGVTNDTTDIILDAGNYDSRVIRKSSRELKIMNETVSRDDKFLDPRAIDIALDRATDLILELAGGTYYSNDDYYPTPVTPNSIVLTLSRLHLLSGIEFSLSQAKKILTALDYAVIEESSSQLTVEIPYFRTDVEVEDDLIADILRIYNYENIPTLPLTTPNPTEITPAILKFEDKLRDILVASGAHEHITTSLVQSNDAVGEVVLQNALSTDQNALRLSLTPKLIEIKTNYAKHGIKVVAIFEIGKVFAVGSSLPAQAGHASTPYLEHRHLTLVTVSTPNDALATLLSNLGITKYTLTNDYQIIINDKVVGNLTVSSFTLNTLSLMSHYQSYTGIVSEFSHNVTRDISLLVPTGLSYADLINTLGSLKLTNSNIECKSMTKLSETINNYLLTLTWADGTTSVDNEIKQITTHLKETLKITSKS